MPSDNIAFVADEQIKSNKRLTEVTMALEGELKSNRRLTEVATALEGQLTALRAELRQLHPLINSKPAEVPAVRTSLWA